MTKTILIILLSLFSSLSFAKDYNSVKSAAKKIISKQQSKNLDRYSFLIYTYAKKHKVDPFIMMALIKVESDFDQKAVSTTGDYSLAQINYKVWKKELSSKGLKLDFNKLTSNHAYAIEKMAIILSIIQKRHAKDNQWYGRYHSNTKKYKSRYLKKVNKYLAQLNYNNTREIAFNH